MEEKRIIEIQKSVADALEAEMLKKAINILEEGMDEVQDWELRSRYTEIQTAYYYMLEYLRAGTSDPDRERLHRELIGKCYVLNDQIAIARQSERSISLYFQMRRKYRRTEELKEIYASLKENTLNLDATAQLPKENSRKLAAALAKEHDSLLSQLFGAVWSSNCWSKSTAESINSIISDSGLTRNDRAVITSALMLSTMKCFEPLKIAALCHAASSNESIIATRAITGIIITLFRYSNRIKFYPEISHALAAIAEDPRILHYAQTIQIQLLRCRETQKIDRKMREEIIPAMMKSPNLRNNKLSIDILKEIEADDDKNPEWKKWIEEDEIKGKIEEMSKWQIEGADLYMSTFSQLKNYPFFGDTCNWFRPFDLTVPAVAEILPYDVPLNKTLIGAICASHIFCNSDKYSFCFTFKNVPQEQRDALMGQLMGDEETASQALDAASSIPAGKRAEIESNQYIQDLYRFFKLSNSRHDFSDPFAMSLNLLENESLATLINNSEATLRTFRYLMEKEYYDEAFNAGKVYEKSGECDAQFFQEMGFCAQKKCDFNTAVDYYTKADIVKPDTLWTLRHIAQCYRLQGESEKALDYYLMAEELAPDNISLLLQTGESYATLKQYDEAFSRFYKVEYLKPDSLRAMRAIAWCSFLTSNDAQARAYYKRLHEMPKPTFEDYLNAAHVEWVSHNNALAVEYYTKAAQLCGSCEKVASHIMHDKEALISRGVNDRELLLLRDLVL